MKSKKTPNPAAAAPKKGALQGPALIVGSLALLSGIVWATLWAVSPPPAVPEPAPPVQIAALVPTLSPDLFTGKTREAYQIAKDIPEVLQHMPCFCGCPAFGHKNNLYCFANDHGADCDMCMDIAIEAKKLHLEKTPIEKITQLIRAKFEPKNTGSH